MFGTDLGRKPSDKKMAQLLSNVTGAVEIQSGKNRHRIIVDLEYNEATQAQVKQEIADILKR